MVAVISEDALGCLKDEKGSSISLPADFLTRLGRWFVIYRDDSKSISTPVKDEGAD